MTTIIRADSAHDFLALVPALAGYLPERSLVCVAFSGARTMGLLRHDLPRRTHDRPALVEAIVGVLCKMPDVDGVVPIAYTDAASGGRRGLPERALLELLVARAGDAGFIVRDAFCVAADGWALLPEPGARVEMRPLGLIEQSRAAAHPAAQVGARGVTEFVQIPAPDIELASAIERALMEIERLSPQPGSAGSAPASGDRAVACTDAARTGAPDTILDRLGDLLDPIAFGEHIAGELRGGRGGPAGALAARLAADEHAWLLHLASRPAVRDAIMLQFAFGPVIGELALDPDSPMSADVTRPDASDGPDETGQPWGSAPRDAVADDLLARLLVGQTTVRPDPARIERALAVLAVAIGNAPAARRPGALCIAAWLAWALGRGSAAGALLDRALALEPGHRMAGLLTAFVGSGALPEWAFSEPASRVRP